MKKIVFLIGLTFCLTACGNKEIVNESQNKEIIDNIQNEEVVIDEKLTPEEDTIINNVEENVSDKIEDMIVEEVKETISQIVECDEDQEEPSISLIEENVVVEEGVEVGKKAVDFEVELLSGEEVKLSDYLGKPVFLNFWATWCGPCVGEMPDIEKIKKEYGDRLVILAINGGEQKEDVEYFINKKGYTFNIGLDRNGDILTTYDSMYIPLSVFIDKDGIIQERKVGALSEEEMRNIVEELVK